MPSKRIDCALVFSNALSCTVTVHPFALRVLMLFAGDPRSPWFQKAECACGNPAAQLQGTATGKYHLGVRDDRVQAADAVHGGARRRGRAKAERL